MPAILSVASRCVFRYFKKFERLSTKLTRHVGPFFIGIAVVLIFACAVTFFDVVFRYQFLQDISYVRLTLGSAWCAYCVSMFTFHYYMAITVPPGCPTNRASPGETPFRPSLYPRVTDVPLTALYSRRLFYTAPSQGVIDRCLDEKRLCLKCSRVDSVQVPKPERTHHCSVCKQCILKYDHHCPWINQCVGLHNERYFLLFLVYFSTSCAFVSCWGWGPLMQTLDFSDDWPYYTSKSMMMMLWILASVMAFALGVMTLWQLWLVIIGETSVESQDNEYYRKAAKERNHEFVNQYDLGKKMNVLIFFNIGQDRNHWSTVLLPLAIPPYTDGWSWNKRHDWEDSAVPFAEQLTDNDSDVE